MCGLASQHANDAYWGVGKSVITDSIIEGNSIEGINSYH